MSDIMILDGEAYTPEVVNDIRECIIQYRDRALEAGQMEAALILSKNIAILADYVTRLEEQ